MLSLPRSRSTWLMQRVSESSKAKAWSAMLGLAMPRALVSTMSVFAIPAAMWPSTPALVACTQRSFLAARSSSGRRWPYMASASAISVSHSCLLEGVTIRASGTAARNSAMTSGGHSVIRILNVFVSAPATAASASVKAQPSRIPMGPILSHRRRAVFRSTRRWRGPRMEPGSAW